MSAPKTKVSQLQSGWWVWQCKCGAFDVCERWSPWRGFDATLSRAIEHSHTHTAERIADRLDEWAGKRTDSSAGGAYWEGYLEGAARAQRDAAHFIREHLVGRTS